MKKAIIASLLCAVALIMSSCAFSNEQKAEKLIKETLKDYLYHPDSYEPISTKVDSMFIDPVTIASIMKISDEIKDFLVENMHVQRKKKRKLNLPWINIQRSFLNDWLI